ncbi:MAG: hypothetical protein OJF49_004338 [Ktedonobacterales bacterium]|nr:MAG: hypothetical protein OJF49_004338 [Ktedonobacterales bacterium]
MQASVAIVMYHRNQYIQTIIVVCPSLAQPTTAELAMLGAGTDEQNRSL